MRRWLIACAFGVGALSCLNPTEIVVELSTNIACTTDHGVAVSVGAPDDDEDAGIAALGSSCTNDGGLGSVTLVPSGGIDAVVGIRVVLGVDASAETCSETRDYTGCVVARRSLRFDPHTPLALPIELDQSCVGIPCTPDSTCIGGTCTDAGVVCDGGTCTIENDGGGTPPPGSCVATPGAVLIQSNVQAGTQTRIVRTSTGWAVLYANNGTAMLSVDTIIQTPTLNIGGPYSVATGSAAMGTFGAANGGFAFTYANSASTDGVFLATDGGVTTWTVPTSVPGASGLFMVDDAGTVVTPFLNNATQQQQPAIVSVVAGGGPALHAPFVLNGGASNIALAQNVTSATDFYATFNDASGNCYVNACSWAGNAFSCTPNIDVIQSCDGIRAAAHGTAHAVVTIVHKQGTVMADAKYAVGSVDGFASLAIVATKDDYAILTGVAGGLFAARYDGTTQPISGPIATGVTGITSLDAVADDPTSSGYAVALVSGTSLFFMHVCK